MIEEQFILRARSYVKGNEGYRNYVYRKGFKENQDYLDKISTLFRWRESNEESWNPREEHFKADFDDVLAKRRNSEDLPERYLLK